MVSYSVRVVHGLGYFFFHFFFIQGSIIPPQVYNDNNIIILLYKNKNKNLEPRYHNTKCPAECADLVVWWVVVGWVVGSPNNLHDFQNGNPSSIETVRPRPSRGEPLLRCAEIAW